MSAETISRLIKVDQQKMTFVILLQTKLMASESFGRCYGQFKSSQGKIYFTTVDQNAE